MKSFAEIGKKIYDTNNPREMRRLLVFRARAFFHRGILNRLIGFFESDPVLNRLFEKSPLAIEQATRSFFYKNSTIEERVKLIEEHYSFLRRKIQDEWLLKISEPWGGIYEIWRGEFEGRPLTAEIEFEPGQKKEGLLSVELNLSGERTDHIYQIMFWIAKDVDGRDALRIGAMQGPNMENAREFVKKFTKFCYGYRTKNLILTITQAVARALGIEKLYAVSTDGYYANNHLRADRKLKTDFGAFWEEAGGKKCEDTRFYELPLAEERKTPDEIKPHKRNLYKKRFALLDEIESAISENIRKILK